MAIEIDCCCYDHEGYSKSWCFPELQSYKHQPVSEDLLSISEILDHGSVSFGRYASESLDWERRSVFSHDRGKEELEKFKAPGLVAQKKAYFEEHYKKIRAMKEALQAQQHVPMSDNIKINNLNSSLGGTVDKSEQAADKRESYHNGCNGKASMKGRMKLSFPASIKQASTLRTPSSHSSKSAERSSRLSNTVNSTNANQLEKQGSVQQAKGTVASTRNKTKLDSSRSTANSVKQLAKPNPTLHRNSILKDDKICPTSKNSDPKSANNSNKKFSEDRSRATVIKSSLAMDKLVSSSKVLSEKIPIRSSVHAKSAKLVSSSSSIRACQVKRSPISQGLVEKSPTRLSVHSRSAKSISEKTTVAGSLRNTILSKRSVDLSMQEKSNQKFGVELGQRSHVKEGMEKKEKDKSSAALGRVPKVAALSARLEKDSNAPLAREPKAAALSARLRKDSNAALERKPRAASSAGLRTDSKHASLTASNVPQARNAKLTQKVVPCRSPDLRHDPREPTQPRLKPIWR